MPEEQLCGCCLAPIARAGLGGWLGVASVEPICLECYRHFLAFRWNCPDRSLDQLLDSVRLVRAIEEMTVAQRRKLQKLIFLRRNHSARADRLVELALEERISLAQLLSML